MLTNHVESTEDDFEFSLLLEKVRNSATIFLIAYGIYLKTELKSYKKFL